MDLTMLRIMSMVAWKAGQYLLTMRPKPLMSPKDFLTDADLEAEGIIRQGLAKHFPDIPLWGEEGGGVNLPVGEQWIVDPVDGTVNFFHGDDHWGISIARVIDGASLDGVICLPAKRQLFFASAGGLSTQLALVDESGRMEKPVSISVSKQNVSDKPLILVEWVKELKDGLDHQLVVETFARLDRRGFLYPQVRNASTASLMMVARGVAGGFVHPRPEPFDIAAACLLVEQAGGVVTDWHGNPWSPFSGERGIVASNGVIHEDLLASVAS